MIIEFIPVKTADDQRKLATMAHEIWHEYWPAHIGMAQTDYMVEKFQSLEAIERDMAENDYEYWFIAAGDAEPALPAEEGNRAAHIVGYTGGHVEPETNRFFISKIYLFARERGHGYASEVVRFYDRLCRDRGLKGSYLTVNKHNDQAVEVYKAKGFKTIDAVETDIGGGFVMDDYIMEKLVS